MRAIVFPIIRSGQLQHSLRLSVFRGEVKEIQMDTENWKRRYTGCNEMPVANRNPYLYFGICSLFYCGIARSFQQFKPRSQALILKKSLSLSSLVCEQPFGRLKRLWIVDLS